jgi:hypothetical protein
MVGKVGKTEMELLLKFPTVYASLYIEHVLLDNCD